MKTLDGPQRQHHALATGKGLTPAPKGSTLSKSQSFGPGVKGKVRKSGTSTGSSGKGGYQSPIGIGWDTVYNNNYKR